MKTSRTVGRVVSGLFGRSEEAAREVDRTDEEWREVLTDEQYRVLRRGGTQAPFGVDTAKADENGMYRCGACDAELFPADTKFDSGTGWPSFSDAVSENVELKRDFSLGLPRTEVVCRRCGGHLGHVFRDGPAPTGQRYCSNRCALSSGRPTGVDNEAAQ